MLPLISSSLANFTCLAQKRFKVTKNTQKILMVQLRSLATLGFPEQLKRVKFQLYERSFDIDKWRENRL